MVIMFYRVTTILVTGPLKQMAHHMLIEFILINFCCLSAVWQWLVWRQMKSLFQLRNLGQGSDGSIHMKSHGASSHLTAPVLLASTFSPSAQTQLSYARLSSLLAGLPPLPLVSWQAVSIISMPAGNCEAQVIIRGVERPTEMASARGTSVEQRWARATFWSPADLARFGCSGQCICHNVSTPCSSPLEFLQGWNHSSFYSSPGSEIIYHEARDLHQLSWWEK